MAIIFALLHRMRQICKLITSNLLQLGEPYCLQQNVVQVISNIWLMAMFAEVSENERINERNPLAKGDNLTNTAR